MDYAKQSKKILSVYVTRTTWPRAHHRYIITFTGKASKQEWRTHFQQQIGSQVFLSLIRTLVEP